MSEEKIILSRAVRAVKIPSGDPMELPAGGSVVITQSLGGSYTVLFADAYLVRIDAKDGDALGKEVPAAAAESGEPCVIDEETVFKQLRLVFDPEIPVNIVDLGLVYDCKIEKLSEGADEGKHKVVIQMTLTAPGCGMGPVIAGDARQKILDLPGIANAQVDLVWSPPWNQGMISEVGKMQLGLI
ncbi:probable FeS assembly SUF system protein SufT [Verrucomicrobium sp. GAS474]|uniref:putative Fe-S cluster assembly protein SufT n=1 Tax=Verrucomicrobium sp. GAS474 TaxID=1882831 RepID=UPI00087A2470|nr:putative Fe-S cluster assembly protein SufT [Verrucomicrobium sp. GAS474]SDT86052.1 probable FeS assembly SUF system protein SufT [Verrucomicrobium sp. GAS474]